MKNVLIIGGAGTVGRCLIKYLLCESKYNITVLDIKTKRTYKRLKKYKNRIRLVFSDMNDVGIIDMLVKEHDIIYHLAGNLPPLADIKEELMNNNEYNSIKVLVNSINKYNPNAMLIYTSSSSVVDNGETKDYYSLYKLKCENYIEKNLTNYYIFRVPYVIGNIKYDNFLFNLNLDDEIEVVLVDNLAYALTSFLDNVNKFDDHKYYISGGDKYRIKYRDLLVGLLDNYGLTSKMLSELLFSEKTYKSPIVDDNRINDIVKYRGKGIKYYFTSLDDNKRVIHKIIGLPIKLIIKK